MKKRAICWCSAVCSIAIWLAGCAAKPVAPVTLNFPDFPEGVTAMDLGQSLTIDVAAANDGGAGVIWTCAGEACGPLKMTPTSLIFKACGLTGKAVVTAASKKQIDVTRRITIAVKLNESPDMLCK
jgi:hypothetical protein